MYSIVCLSFFYNSQEFVSRLLSIPILLCLPIVFLYRISDNQTLPKSQRMITRLRSWLPYRFGLLEVRTHLLPIKHIVLGDHLLGVRHTCLKYRTTGYHHGRFRGSKSIDIYSKTTLYNQKFMGLMVLLSCT